MPHEPASVTDVLLRWIQGLLGTGPLGVFLTTAIFSFVAAALTALAIRSALKKEWSSIGDWKDRIIIVVASANSERGKLDRCHLGALPIMKGRLVLEWPDVSALALAQVNADLARLVSRGLRLANLTAALTGGLTFITMFILQSALACLIVLLGWPHMNEQNYVYALFLVFLWPGALYVFQHATLPDWRGDLDRTEADMKKLGRQFDFVAVEVS